MEFLYHVSECHLIWLVGLVSCHLSEGDVIPFSEDVSSVFVSFKVVLVPIVEVCDGHVLVVATGVVVFEWWSGEHGGECLWEYFWQDSCFLTIVNEDSVFVVEAVKKVTFVFVFV